VKTHGTKKGFALLAFLIVLIGVGAFGLARLLSSSVSDDQQLSQEKTRRALFKAREALLSYAVEFLVQDDYARMGRLPCPDVVGSLSPEGAQDPSCGDRNANSLGLFPFKSVGLGKLEDGHGQCLWYAVSGTYKNSPDLDMVNWDSPGMIQIEDENGVLKHPGNPAAYPVAVIIAPGAPLLGQDRSADGSLPLCGANHNRSNFLEGGSRLNYAAYLPNDAGTIWPFLDASLSTRLANADANDKIAYVTRRDIWERVKQSRELDTGNASSAIATLTRQLAECLVAYSNESSNGQKILPYAGRLVLDDYQDKTKYKDKLGRYAGRFPQNIKESNHRAGNVLGHDPEKAFVVQEGGTEGYCQGKTGLDAALWENWKDQFFYVVAKDYRPESTKSLPDRCNDAADCLDIGGNSKVAAIVFFAEERSPDQDRDLTPFTDDNQTSHRLGLWNQYLDGINRHLYAGNGSTNQFDNGVNDYAYCVFKQASGDLNAGPC